MRRFAKTRPVRVRKKKTSTTKPGTEALDTGIGEVIDAAAEGRQTVPVIDDPDDDQTPVGTDDGGVDDAVQNEFDIDQDTARQEEELAERGVDLDKELDED